MIRPMLDDLELPDVQEITTYDRRSLSELKPPGMDGSLVQNLGRRPLRVVLWGVATDGALGLCEKLDATFRAAKPVPFVADIVADAKLDQVIVEDLRLQELAGKPQRFSYVVTLREFIETVDPAPAAAAGVDTAIADDAIAHVGDVAAGIAILLAFALALARWVVIFTELLASILGIGHAMPLPDTSNLFQQLKDALQQFKDFLDTETATIKPAITALKPLVPQIGDLLTKLIALLSQLKVAVTALSVGSIPGLAKITQFTTAVTALVQVADALLPAHSIDPVVAAASVVTGLPSFDQLKQQILDLLTAIIADLNSLNS